MKLCITNYKGGVGKTKTSVHLALGLSRYGRTLLVDADTNQTAALDNANAQADWPDERCTVFPCATRELARRVAPMMADYEHVLFDVGPKNPVLMRQAMSLSDGVIVPCRPTNDDLPELHKTFETAAEVDAIHPLWVAVLLTQVRLGMSAGEDAREFLQKLEMPAFKAQVRLLKRYEQSRGQIPLDDLGDYEGVLAEVMAVEKAQVS